MTKDGWQPVAATIPLRIPVVVAIAFGVLAPAVLFGATWILALRLKPALETETSPSVVSEVRVPPPSRAIRQSAPVATARAVPPAPAPAGDQGESLRVVSVASPASPGEPVAAPAASPSSAPRVAPAAAVSTPPPRPPTPLRVTCGIATCAPGDVCCNPTCGICTPPGQTCTRQDCGLASNPTSALCGQNTCNVGDVCCNPTCGICVHPGATCSQTKCDDGPTFPVSQPCGMSTCNVGSVCCDPSCGLCAPVAECAHLHC